MRLRDLLDSKDFRYRARVTVQPGEAVSAAIRKMKEYDRGSLAVCDDDARLVGIITERDIVRKYATGGRNTGKARVRDVMTKRIVVAKPEDDLNYAIGVMKELRIRHIPIVDDRENVIGMISMRDLLGVQLEQCNIEARFLADYIKGY